MKSIIIFGGSGFVGTHLIYQLGDMFDCIYIADIRNPRWHCQEGVPENPRVVYIDCDVRKAVPTYTFDRSVSCIVNLSAVHTSPGFLAHEYFHTNILGARNICTYANDAGVNHIIFTSSISVYGPGEDEKTEESVPMPAIPYGSSKIIAEFIHREWLSNGHEKKLSIIRPAVIFGVGEGGNFTRIANSLEKGFFAYPGRTDTIKGCVYVKDLCRFIIDRILNECGYSVFNFCYPDKITIRDIVHSFKRTLGYRAPELVVPLWMVNGGAALFNMFSLPFIQRMGLVPERIVKLVKSTNISSRKLIESGFVFKYPLDEALRDWANDCGGKSLF